jgi:hypothetical protein
LSRLRRILVVEGGEATADVLGARQSEVGVEVYRRLPVPACLVVVVEVTVEVAEAFLAACLPVAVADSGGDGEGLPVVVQGVSGAKTRLPG